jgi:uncharacterized membrane protein YcjF (UPF0283 family)
MNLPQWITLIANIATVIVLTSIVIRNEKTLRRLKKREQELEQSQKQYQEEREQQWSQVQNNFRRLGG